ncbi:DUF6438 domain-containing protein [Chloroflexota bacterium]
MIKIALIVTLIVISLFIPGCVNETPTPGNLEDVMITLERTVCFGACPVYKLTIYGDGTVIYEGIEFVKIEGTVTSTINEDKIRQLVSAFREIDYSSLNDSYEEFMATDMPYAITSITIDGKTKTVRHYHGDFSAPEELTQLENKIDEIVSSDQWVKISP